MRVWAIENLKLTFEIDRKKSKTVDWKGDVSHFQLKFKEGENYTIGRKSDVSIFWVPQGVIFINNLDQDKAHRGVLCVYKKM